MNDFLAKPIETSKLNSILERWIPDSKKESCTARVKKSVSTPIEIEGLDAAAGIAATGGDAGYYLKILALFSNDCKTKIDEINKQAANIDKRLFVVHTHALKSALYSIGARELSKIAGKLEEAGRNGNNAIIEQYTGRFVQKLGMLINNINKSISGLQKNKSNTDEIDKNILESLKKALNDMDAQTAGDILKELRNQNFGSDISASIENIYQDFLMFEYDEALSVIDDLLV